MTIKYLTNKRGNKTAVVISIKDWEAYQKRMDRLEQERKFRNNLKNSFNEAKEIVNGKKKGIALEEFLNEL